jgi:ubiquinone/menaquinone biosynthesis C-methylase UbiE
MEYVFDVFAERYDNWYDKPFGKSAFSLEKDCIELLCGDLAKPFLAVGVGTGRFAAALNLECGVDRSIGVLRFAKKREIEVVRGDGQKLPFADESFGAVFIIVTLCFVDDPLKLLEEAARVSKRDGAIILGLILRESPWAAFYEKKGEEGNVFYKIARFYSFEEVESMLGNVGLQIEEMRSTMFQRPTVNPLDFEFSRKGFFKEAGFIAIKARKRDGSY